MRTATTRAASCLVWVTLALPGCSGPTVGAELAPDAASGSGGGTGGDATDANSGGGAASGGTAGADSGGSAGAAGTSPGFSAKYPGDVGIEQDQAVVWSENFEEGSLAALVARYDDSKQSGLSLVSDKPTKSSGAASARLTAGGAGPAAVDIYKRLVPGHDELYVRYYAKYQSNVEWHHTGVWVGGYNPPSSWPSPMAGLKPDGDDRINISLEPIGGTSTRMDFYAYWMKMHSWMDQPSGGTAYYGNSLIHEPTLMAKEQWQCFEIHVKLNPSPSSGSGAELGLWVDDQPVIQLTDSTPTGYWVKDSFCPDSTTSTECTNYKPASSASAPLDLQFRNTTDLKLNAFWPQNYITSGGAGSVWYDDMVVAKSRIGCIQ